MSSRVRTDPSAWDEARTGAPLWTPPAVPTVVLVPHPDDEVLMCGGLIATQRLAGVPVTVIAATDGEQAYPGVVSPRLLGAHRRREHRTALAALGVPASHEHRLGLPDSGLGAHMDRLAEALAPHLSRDVLLVAPWEHDVHADHEACGRAAVRASEAADVLLVQGLFWTWHWRGPEHLPVERLRALVLSQDARGRRARALDAHRSQLTALLAPAPLLEEDDLWPARGPHEHLLIPEGA